MVIKIEKIKMFLPGPEYKSEFLALNGVLAIMPHTFLSWFG